MRGRGERGVRRREAGDARERGEGTAAGETGGTATWLARPAADIRRREGGRGGGRQRYGAGKAQGEAGGVASCRVRRAVAQVRHGGQRVKRAARWRGW